MRKIKSGRFWHAGGAQKAALQTDADISLAHNFTPCTILLLRSLALVGAVLHEPTITTT
jgi:hypothetical protein